jgi:hypothetical protein
MADTQAPAGKPARLTVPEKVTEQRSNPAQTKRAIESLRAATPTRPGPIDGGMIDSVARLLNGDAPAPAPAQPPEGDEAPAPAHAPEAGEAGEAAPAAEAAPEDTSPRTWDELVKATGATKEALYAVEIPLGNGESMTLGELKDRAREYRDIDVARVELDERRERETMEGIDSRRRIAGIMAKLAPVARHLPPDLMQAVEADYREHLQRESAFLRTAAPEWGDPKAAETGRALIVDFLRPYGISAAEVAAFDDHRFILAAHDAAKAKSALKEAREAIKRRDRSAEGDGLQLKGREAAAKSAPKRGDNAAQRAQRTQSERVGRISRLLNGG